MKLKITVTLWLYIATIALASETRLFYYKADNKTADAVIQAVESKRFSYDEMESKLEKVARSGKLKLITKSILSEEEKLITKNSSSLKIDGEKVPMGLSIRASSFEMRGAYTVFIDAQHNKKRKAKMYQSKHSIIDAALPAKSWQIVTQWSDSKNTEFILIQTTDKAAAPVPPVSKEIVYLCQYHLIEITENDLKKAPETLLEASKIIQSASIINKTGSKSIISDALIWIKKGDSAQLGLSVEQEIKRVKRGASPSLHTTISWSKDDKFNTTPDYTFKETIPLTNKGSTLLLPKTKPDKKANLAIILTIKKL